MGTKDEQSARPSSSIIWRRQSDCQRHTALLCSPFTSSPPPLIHFMGERGRARRHAAITLKASPILSNETRNEREGRREGWVYFFHSSVLKHASVVCLMANELGTVCKQPSIVRGELTRRSDKEGGYDDDGQWQKEKLRFRNKPVHSLSRSVTHCRSHLLPFL